MVLENNATYLLGVVASYGSLFLEWVSNEHQILKRLSKLIRNEEANPEKAIKAKQNLQTWQFCEVFKFAPLSNLETKIYLYFKQTQSMFKHC